MQMLQKYNTMSNFSCYETITSWSKHLVIINNVHMMYIFRVTNVIKNIFYKGQLLFCFCNGVCGGCSQAAAVQDVCGYSLTADSPLWCWQRKKQELFLNSDGFVTQSTVFKFRLSSQCRDVMQWWDLSVLTLRWYLRDLCVCFPFSL